MIPRVSVDAISSDATLEEVKTVFRDRGYSRLPVYRERLDSIVGILFRRDLEPFLESPEGFELARLLHPTQYLPETAKLGQALRQMQATNSHLAIVVDEHGGMEGIITLEDLLEEIVGEINDEFDEEVRDQITRVSDGRYLLEGKLAIRDLNRELELSLPEESGYTTLAGFLMARAGRVLQNGDVIEHEAMRFTVEKTDRRRIRLVGLSIAQDAGNDITHPTKPSGALALLLSVLISFSY
jgi:CBS domain containing-hemolysin-like protein